MPIRKKVLSRSEKGKLEVELGLTLTDEDEDLLDIRTSPLPRKEEPIRAAVVEKETRRERQDEPYVRKPTRPIKIGRTIEAQRSL